ncbi:DUF2637 domain-containing protein [Kitasatospora sp. NPDC087314]|uniref:DUF2637 domain-containing protein n=1 Tax=Kitasatospora sp. NPDC087314 TaxID=3364068 RepID=UPI0037F8F253
MATQNDSATATAPINPPPRDARTWLAIGAAITSTVLTAAAFWLSYEHLHDVAATNGLQGAVARSWAWPATVDLFIIVGELLILRASLAARVDGWAIALTIAGSGASIALNVAGVGAGAPRLTYVVAAVPPIAALLAFGALMRQVHEYLTPQSSPSDDESVYDDSQPEQPVAPPAMADALVWQDVEEAMRPVADDTETVTLMTVPEVAAAKGVAEGTVRSWHHRNKLPSVQRDSDGRLLFHPATVAALD